MIRHGLKIGLCTAVALAGCVSTSTFESKVSELEKARAEYDELREQYSELLREDAALKVKYEGLRSDYTAVSKERDIFRLTSEEMQSRLEVIEAEANRLDDKTSELREELLDSRQTMSSQIGELVERSSRLASSNADLEQEKKDLEAEVMLRDDRITQLSTALRERDEENALLSEQLAEHEKKLSSLTHTYESLVGELKQEIEEGEIQIARMRDELSVQMVDRILFSSGSADINQQGKEVLKKVGRILSGIADRQIRVEGHTDNVPISARLKEQYPSNWELSTARATTVVRFLQDTVKIEPARLLAAGYGEHRPVAGNDTLENRARNRRIRIVLVPMEVRADGTGDEGPEDSKSGDEQQNE